MRDSSIPKTLEELFDCPIEVLKPLASIFDADHRFAHMILFGEEDDSTLTYTFDDHYNRFASLPRLDRAPVEVTGSFVTAQHLGIASWWFFPFSAVSENQAYGTLELALRRKMNAAPARGLKERIEHAIKKGWFVPGELPELNPCVTPSERKRFLSRPRADDGAEMLRVWAEEMPRDRNYLAHGNFLSGTDPFITLDIVSQLILQLYR